MLKWLMLAVYLLLTADVLLHMVWSFDILWGKRRGRDAAVCAFLVLCASSVIVGKYLPRSAVQRWMVIGSNYWLGFFIYVVTLLVVLDLIWLLVKVLRRKKPRFTRARKQKIAAGAFAGIFLISLAAVVYGGIHERNIKTAEYEIAIDKDGGNREHLRAVLISDLHLGYSIGSRDMEQMVEKINAQHPDIVFLAGDIYDNDYDAIDDPDHVAEIFAGIESELGVYAIYGNHDVTETLVGGFPVGSSKNALRDARIEEMMKKAGITMLEDEALLIDDSFYLVGRLDGEKNGFGSKDRALLEELLKPLDKNRPILVMNHEPDELSDYAEAGVDLLLSGHTHAGQFFPLTVVQPFAWENYWGLKKIGSMYSVVTSGTGVYGPPIRVLTDSEIVVLDITFQ